MKRKFDFISNDDDVTSSISCGREFIKRIKLKHENVNENVVLNKSAIEYIKSEFLILHNENLRIKKEYDKLNFNYINLLNEHEILKKNSLAFNFSNNNIF